MLLIKAMKIKLKLLFLLGLAISGFSQRCKYELHQVSQEVMYLPLKYEFEKNLLKIESDTVFLRTDGKVLTFINHGENTDDILQEKFTYIGYLKKIGHHLIEVKGYESTTYLLINQKNADKVDLWSRPILNSSWSQIATVSGNLKYDGIFNGIQIFNVLNGNIKKECELIFSKFEVEKATWVKKDNLLIKTMRYSGSNRKYKNYLLSIIH